jgi:Fe-S cluster biogenesis protein NfuA
MPGQPEFQKRLQTIEELLSRIEAAGDPALRTTVRELVQIIMDLHGAGLERMLELIGSDGDAGASLVPRLGRDELVGSLLVLYGIHPMTLEARVGLALDKARSRLRSHDGEVELLSLGDGAVRLRLRANGHGCGSTAQALKEIVEDAIYLAAPDVTTLVIEGAEDNKQGFVPLEMLQGITPAQRLSNGLVLSAAEKG